MGKFERLKPVQHYGEYFEEQDRKYKDAGKPGLSSAVMQRSQTKAVAAFDELVDEFNSNLPRIITDKDNEAVQTFFRRASGLKDKLPADNLR